MKIYTYQGRKNICGEKIREMRVKSRLSQSELAAKVQTEGITLERDTVSAGLKMEQDLSQIMN